jgi:hypothetical protein
MMDEGGGAHNAFYSTRKKMMASQQNGLLPGQ